MNWLRNRLRAWLGIPAIELRLHSLPGDVIVLQRKVADLENPPNQPTWADISRKQFEIENALREFKEVRDQMLDPKRVPIRTRNGSQMRQLMEQEP